MLPTALLLLASIPASAVGDPAEPPVRVTRQVPMMGTVLVLTVEGADYAQALAASEAAVRALEAAEARLSTWRPESELSRLNRAPVGESVALSPELAAELAAARRCYELTGGAFDPGIGPVLDAWGLRTGGRVPGAAELAAARAASGLDGLELLPGGRAVRRREGLRLEEGAFGKGAGLDRALEALRTLQPPVRALLDLGGQVALLRPRADWRIALADPADRGRPVVELSGIEGSVSTSGNGERSFEVAGHRLGHLFDPRTGRPAEDFGSLTVVANSGLLADCLSTGLYVLGPARAFAWAERHPEVEVLVLERRNARLRARATRGLTGRLRSLDRQLELEVVAGGKTTTADSPKSEGPPSDS